MLGFLKILNLIPKRGRLNLILILISVPKKFSFGMRF